MIENKNVHGSQVKVDGLEFNVDTVYIRTNIRKEKETLGDKEVEFWVYDEKQYTYEEYIVILNSKVDSTNSAQDDLILDNAYRVAMLELATTAALNI